MKRWVSISGLLISCLILLTGCWDSKEVQSINFITAIGIDYVDNQYIAYAQLIDFSSIAKQETPTSRETRDIWTGRGEGTTLNMAINDLYETSQQLTLWTHVKAIVLSKRVLDGRLEDIFNTLLHSGQLRYTPWIYATEHNIPDVLSPSALLNQSAQTIELFEPMRLYKQHSGYEPIRLHQLLDGLREPASVVLLPSVSTRNETWFNGDKTPPLVRMDGFYVISKGTSQGRVAGADADGTRYVNYERVHQYPLYVYGNGGKTPDLTLLLHHPKTKIKAKKQGDGITFDLVTTVKSAITEDHGAPRSPDAMEQEAEKQIESQIRDTFEKTKSRMIDSYGLVEHLYRHNLPLWKQEVYNRADPLQRFKLGKVEVHVDILNASTYKYSE
ncbi:germination protein, Ger(x)C family protein [Paenibacillus sp. FSL R5-192]|uniref:Ger(x)C family spore germination protein n=1 Tax=unclassified Paenibacillus TaxID=185978 RepID=UPI0003E1D4A0|nr:MULTISPECIES: Ger(x)C family spore germination protein [unclassified Paenibacillus]ETT40200.1 germination protein, Ger(x)C family protein [Paenibacillus sp. FSL R5-192]ETT46769.1 germination protein, Ger(x)C family protein [Paenibacillus sp. FSL H7-689]